MSPEVVTVKSSQKSISMKPIIQVSNTKKKLRLISVGETIYHNELSKVINLFHLEKLPGNISKKECFRSFFFHVFSKVLNKKWLPFAKVQFKGLYKLEKTLEGKQEKIIWAALRQAGASSCSFVAEKFET